MAISRFGKNGDQWLKSGEHLFNRKLFEYGLVVATQEDCINENGKEANSAGDNYFTIRNRHFVIHDPNDMNTSIGSPDSDPSDLASSGESFNTIDVSESSNDSPASSDSTYREIAHRNNNKLKASNKRFSPAKDAFNHSTRLLNEITHPSESKVIAKIEIMITQIESLFNQLTTSQGEKKLKTLISAISSGLKVLEATQNDAAESDSNSISSLIEQIEFSLDFIVEQFTNKTTQLDNPQSALKSHIADISSTLDKLASGNNVTVTMIEKVKVKLKRVLYAKDALVRAREQLELCNELKSFAQSHQSVENPVLGIIDRVRALPSTDSNPPGTSLAKISSHPELSPRKIFSAQLAVIRENLSTLFASIVGDKGISVFNQNRRDEVFRPLIFNNENSDDQFGLYVLPWLSNNDKSFEFSGFTNYVMAGCLFGSGISGVDQHVGRHSLVKHDPQFFPGQKIIKITCDTATQSPYEAMLKVELEKCAVLMKQFSERGSPTTLNYHLPYYDYMLFGVDLFIIGRINLKALNSLFKNILTKKNQVADEVRAIFNKHGINAIIESPFDNLFGTIDRSITDSNDQSSFPLATHILNTLGIPSTEVDPPTVMPEHEDLAIKTERLNKQKDLVQKCINLLITNTHNLKHRDTWQDFVAASPSLNNLEDMLKIANACMVGVAIRDKNDGKVCTTYPLSERQIPVSFAQYQKHLSKGRYPTCVNLTVMDPLVTYSDLNDGMVFYFDYHASDLGKLLVNKKLMQTALRNLSFFGSKNAGQQPVSLESAFMSRSNNYSSSDLPSFNNRR
jgi:hypothetical protein